jgi:dTDP-4-dehydrorhamnose reductase
MNKILVTGATGLLGSSLVPYLKKIGYEVVTHAKTLQADLISDLANRVKTHEILERIQPNIIINLVSLTNVELCEEQINLAYLTNTRSVENLVDWIKITKSNCYLVQISTDHVYDGIGPHNEDNVTISNNYAFSKYAGDLAAQRISSTILRTNFIGRSQVSSRESLTDWVYNSMINGRQIQVLSDVYFSPLPITTLVKMIELIVQKKPIGIYNLGSNNGMSKADFVFRFAETLKLPINNITRIDSSRAKFLKAYRPKDMRMDCSKFENALGVKLPNLHDLIQPLTEEYYEIS